MRGAPRARGPRRGVGADDGDGLADAVAAAVQADELAVDDRPDRAVVGLRGRRVAAVVGDAVSLRAVRAGEVEVTALGVDDRVGGRGTGGDAQRYEAGDEHDRGGAVVHSGSPGRGTGGANGRL